MKLPPEGARWLISLRWLACVLVFGAAFMASSVLGVVERPLPLYLVGCGMAAYNLGLFLFDRGPVAGQAEADRGIFRQIVLDLAALTLLLYFSDISRNPFVFFFVFHMIIASMYLHGVMPAVVAAIATALVGTVILAEYLGWLPRFELRFAGEATRDWRYLLGVFTAFASTVWITVYCTTAIHQYVDRAHAELRQKEKMVGIGQLVAGIAHQIANPLDGVQNCLARIGEEVKGDPRLSEYVKMMAEALQRIERTAKRVQAFARPRGVTLQSTDVNGAVVATLQVLGTKHGRNVRIETDLGDVPAVLGDPYTLQEVLFNLCANALAAMPDGGKLTLRTSTHVRGENGPGAVAVEVSDTGVGIPRANLDKIFEPFFTTRAESGGTGLGLSLCRMLISEMGGALQVRSALGQGSTFTVILQPANDKGP